MALVSWHSTTAKRLDVRDVVAALEASTGMRAVARQVSDDHTLVHCRWIAGTAELHLGDTGVTVEVMPPASLYFLAHLEAALEAAGARRSTDSTPRPPSLLTGVAWRALPLGQRLANGSFAAGLLGITAAAVLAPFLLLLPVLLPFLLVWGTVHRLRRRRR